MRPFDLEAAKNGAAVCTRSGHDARIICYDRVFDVGGIFEPRPIVALVYEPDARQEYILDYFKDGKRRRDSLSTNDLQMK